jgi:drug/metabolite transporter (DMT)-like permease
LAGATIWFGAAERFVPVVLGNFVVGESITQRTMIGTALVLASVVLILRKEKTAT